MPSILIMGASMLDYNIRFQVSSLDTSLQSNTEDWMAWVCSNEVTPLV